MYDMKALYEAESVENAVALRLEDVYKRQHLSAF